MFEETCLPGEDSLAARDLPSNVTCSSRISTIYTIRLCDVGTNEYHPAKRPLSILLFFFFLVSTSCHVPRYVVHNVWSKFWVSVEDNYARVDHNNRAIVDNWTAVSTISQWSWPSSSLSSSSLLSSSSNLSRPLIHAIANSNFSCGFSNRRDRSGGSRDLGSLSGRVCVRRRVPPRPGKRYVEVARSLRNRPAARSHVTARGCRARLAW